VKRRRKDNTMTKSTDSTMTKSTDNTMTKSTDNTMTKNQYEEFADTKGVIRIRISKRNRQHNGQKKKYKRTNNDLQNIHIKLKIE
jgi:hypothetical protein